MQTAGHCDLLIIGGGQAGYPLAKKAAAAGLSVVLVEEGQLGGSCVNYGCTPTKAAIASARVAHLARRSQEFGISVGEVAPDYRAVIARAARIAGTSRDNMESSMAGSENPRLIRGHARLAAAGDGGRTGGAQAGGGNVGNGGSGGNGDDPIRVTIQDAECRMTELTATDVVIDTGAKTVLPGIDGLNDVHYIHARNWLEVEELPEHLIIVGASHIALEMAQLYRRLGSRVTVLDRSDRIIKNEEPEVSEALEAVLRDEGVAILHETQAEKVEYRRGGPSTELSVHLNAPHGKTLLAASHIFLATGRAPNTADLGLETLGVETDKTGAIIVDGALRTSVPHVWAAGDVRGGPMFTHTAWDDHRILAAHLLNGVGDGGDGERTTDRIVPYALFTDPELGRVGMTERQAREAGHQVKVATYPMERSSKAYELSETKGLIKLVADGKSGRILGASLLCSEASELVHILIDAMNSDEPYSVISDSVFIHPTLAEAVQSAVSML